MITENSLLEEKKWTGLITMWSVPGPGRLKKEMSSNTYTLADKLVVPWLIKSLETLKRDSAVKNKSVRLQFFSSLSEGSQIESVYRNDVCIFLGLNEFWSQKRMLF